MADRSFRTTHPDMQTLQRLSVPLALLMLSGCAAAPAKRDPRDPWERVNRATYTFNDHLDRAIAKPVARTYQKVTPEFMRTGVSNFFDNLNYTTVVVNDLLQGKVVYFFSDTGRFVMNSTLGMAGLLDPASAAGLERRQTDFGVTLGKWGIGGGPYLVLPILGPSSVRDAVGRGGDVFTTAPYWVLNKWQGAVVWTANTVDTRYRLLGTEKLLENTYDRYAFLRNAYLQRRDFLVHGNKASSQEQEEEEKMLDELDKQNQDGGAPKSSPAPQPPPPQSPPEQPQPR
jgi:phospholipid-binding lipoprotein MlaA